MIATAMEHSGDQDVPFVSVVDDMILDRAGSNTRPELRSEATHPRLFGQQAESVDDGVDESVRRVGLAASATSDQISSRSCSARADSRYGISRTS